MAEEIRASLDRFEEDFAVIYSDQDGRRFDVPRELMAEIRAGARVVVYVEDNQVVRVEEDRETTDEAKDRIKKKYQRLLRGDHL